MKKVLVIPTLILMTAFAVTAQEYKIITVVESIVPGGLGRSRMIEMKSDIDVENLTTERTDGKKSDQGDVKRRDAKIDEFAETKLLNFYSLTGINMQNVASNDAIVTSRMNSLSDEGWKLAFVVGGVESDSGKEDGNGIFVTRYIFKRDTPMGDE